MALRRLRTLAYVMLIALTACSTTMSSPQFLPAQSPLEDRIEQQFSIEIYGDTADQNLYALEVEYNKALQSCHLFSNYSHLLYGIELSSDNLEPGQRANASIEDGIIRIDPNNIYDYFLVHELSHLRFASNPDHELRWNAVLPIGHYAVLMANDSMGYGPLYSKYDADEDIALLTTEIYLLRHGYGTGLFPLQVNSGGIDLLKTKLNLLYELGYISESELAYTFSNSAYFR